MAYKISDDCISCGACAAECPVSAISEGDTQYVIDDATCIIFLTRGLYLRSFGRNAIG